MTRAVCVREIQKSLDQSVKTLIQDKIRAHGLIGGFRILDTHIETPFGGRIIFQGMQNHTAESIKSLEGYDVAWVEEAQSLSQRSLDLLRPTIRAPGSELWFSWNPNKASDPVDTFLRGGVAPPDSVVVEANYSDNPWLPNELKADLEWDRTRDPDKYRHVWLGEYLTQSKASVFRNWTVQEFATPKDAVFRFGADWGFSVDPTVLVRAFIGRLENGEAVPDQTGRHLFIDREAWAVGCEIDQTPALFDTVEGSRQWTIRADSARPETVSYMQRRGFKIVPAVKGPGSLEDGVEFLKSFDIVVHPRCGKTAEELATYSFKTDPLTEEILPVLEDKNNHVIDALRYALEGLRRAPRLRKADPARNPPDLWGRPRQEGVSWKTA